ncbi:DUF3302 domain-containing protein [Pseudomonas chlororaphis]|uniref:DUF3302 domain-containing protein n=1 Tax=Pseudomonas chlororaphis TaxID=587753 RepID=UPI00236694B9|nr:DUF3302 domain-containing protein [Pseudomonas chlororaphis]WDH25614.1 DUF3302 domain-containing protein [Pseudomonas chlororaphis]
MLDQIALGMLVFAGIILFYGIIVLHDIPYEIAVHRNHPHQDAIHAAGWVSLFTLHALWPFLWIWAMLYREDRGWGFATDKARMQAERDLAQELAELRQRIERLEGQSQAGPRPEGKP